MGLAVALGLSPLHLVLPDDAHDTGLDLFPGADGPRVSTPAFRDWWRGDRPLIRRDDADGTDWSQSPERRREFHSHDLPDEAMRAQAAEHPAVSMATVVRELLSRMAVAALVGEAVSAEELDDLDRALSAVRKHSDLLRESTTRRGTSPPT